jgi:hypothetical protein
MKRVIASPKGREGRKGFDRKLATKDAKPDFFLLPDRTFAAFAPFA